LPKSVHRGGRPSKLTDKYLKTLEKVLDDPDVYILTDNQLFEYVNDQLPKEERVHIQTFKNYKASKDTKTVDEEKVSLFLYLIEKGRRKSMINVYRDMKEDNIWQRHAWFLERKEKSLNLRHQHEIKSEVNVVGFDYKVIENNEKDTAED